MYVTIENGKITQWADWEFEGSCFIKAQFETFDPEKYRVDENGTLVDISNTNEYAAKKAKEKMEFRMVEINNEFLELDMKSIRALRGSDLEDVERLMEIELDAERLRAELEELQQSLAALMEADGTTNSEGQNV
jgi:hypothetical protein